MKTDKQNLTVYHRPGKIWSENKGDIHYYDQLSPEIFSTILSRLPTRIHRRYNITQQEYYCKVVYGSTDVRPNCTNKGCTNKAIFVNLRHGFLPHCSAKCQNDLKNKNKRTTRLKSLILQLRLRNKVKYDREYLNSLEVKHRPGEIWTEGTGKWMRVYNQLSSDIVKLHHSKIAGYILQTYGLTAQEYYSLVVHGDKNFIPVCNRPECTNQVNVFKAITTGFNETCSRECANSLVIRRGWSDPNGTQQSTRALNIATRNWFIQHHGHTKPAILYLGYDNDFKYIKIGITFDLSDRKRRLSLDRIRGVVYSNSKEIAELEYNIKEHFKTRGEWFRFDQLNEILSVVRKFKNS